MSATSDKLEVIILGSGPSCTTPNLACLTRDETSANPPCRCCASIYEDNEDAKAAGGKKNIRGNISGVIRKTWADGKQSTILIDCGKTFNRSVVDHFPPNGIRKIDAVLLTHDHADAMMGIDDLRVLTWQKWIQESVPVYCDMKTFSILNERFPYLVQAGTGSGTGFTPALQFNIIEPHKQVNIAGIDIVPFETQHGTTNVSVPMSMAMTKGGEDSTPGTPLDGAQASMTVKVPYMCLAFVIEDEILWMTDTNEIPQKAWNVIHYGLEAAESGPAPDQLKRRLPLAFLDLADDRMYGRAHLDLRGFVTAVDKLEAGQVFSIGTNHTLCYGELVALGEEIQGMREAGKEDAFIKTALYGEISHLASDGLFDKVKEKKAHFRPSYDGMKVTIEGQGEEVSVVATE